MICTCWHCRIVEKFRIQIFERVSLITVRHVKHALGVKLAVLIWAHDLVHYIVVHVVHAHSARVSKEDLDIATTNFQFARMRVIYVYVRERSVRARQMQACLRVCRVRLYQLHWRWFQCTDPVALSGRVAVQIHQDVYSILFVQTTTDISAVQVNA